MNKRRLLLIGVDGATFRIIDPLIKEGRLPNIAKMKSIGVHGTLNSTIPLVSPVAWTSLMTGTNPDKHNIYDFVRKVPGSYKFEVNTAANRKVEPFWMNLSSENKRVFVFGVTMTYPPDPVNGYMISGLGTPQDSDKQSYIYPPEFAMDITNDYADINAMPEADLRKLSSSDIEKEKYLKSIFDDIDNKMKFFKYMWQKEKFDFSFLFFIHTDGISHYFWRYMDSSHKQYEPGAYSDSIYKVYEKIDSAIGELLTLIEDETDVVLVSDHGFGSLNRVVFLNNWLASKDYLRFKDVSSFKTLLYKSVGLVRRRKRRKKNIKEIDWRKTKAFFSGTVGNIFLNIKDREPDGIIDISDYGKLSEELQKDLMDLYDPETGENIVEKVYKKDELFNVKDGTVAPDLFVTFKSGYSVVGEEIGLHAIKDTGGIISNSNNWSGTHELEGVFIASGKSFKRGVKVKGATLIDIAPTILYLLGNSIPESMDGKVLKDVINDEFLKLHPISYSNTDDVIKSEKRGYEKGEDESIIKQLKNLGYID